PGQPTTATRILIARTKRARLCSPIWMLQPLAGQPHSRSCRIPNRPHPRMSRSTRRSDKTFSGARSYRINLHGKTYSIYRGDLHRHTEISWDGGGDGSLLDAYRYARDAARLDFVGISDHRQCGGALFVVAQPKVCRPVPVAQFR